MNLLTNRELEVLNLISNGHSTKEIAIQLYLGASTIETYRRNLFFKLDCSNMAHLVRRGFERGYLRIEIKQSKNGKILPLISTPFQKTKP